MLNAIRAFLRFARYQEYVNTTWQVLFQGSQIGHWQAFQKRFRRTKSIVFFLVAIA